MTHRLREPADRHHANAEYGRMRARLLLDQAAALRAGPAAAR
jgi:hypothetical protein